MSVSWAPGTGKTLFGIARGSLACHRGDCVLFDTASGWVGKLQQAHQSGTLAIELTRLGGYELIIIDKVGYVPFEPDGANLFFQLVSSRCEHASVILTSNLPLGRWGEGFGDQTVGAAVINRLVRYAEVPTLTGKSCRTRERNLDTLPSKKPKTKRK